MNFGLFKSTFSSRVAMLVLATFLVVAFFGAFYSPGMEKRSDGMMSGCMFSAKNCTMTIGQHFSQWQSMFTTTAPQKATSLALLILLTISFIAVAILRRNLLLLSNHYTIRWRLYIRQYLRLWLFNPLGEAFSQGILNPKIY